MLASKPCFLHTYSSDTRFIFIVENIPQKLEKKTGPKAVLFFCSCDNSATEKLRDKSLQKIGQIRPPDRTIRLPNLTDGMHYF